MKKIYEKFNVEDYEVNYFSVSSRYNFHQYREESAYERSFFYSEESKEFFCDVRIDRIA